MESATAAQALETPLAEPKADAKVGLTWHDVTSSPIFRPAVALGAALLFLYWSLVSRLPHLWMGKDGYYSHGFLVPLIAGYVIYRWSDRMKALPVRSFALATVPLAFFTYMGIVAQATNVQALMSVAFLGTLLCAIWLVAGTRWMLALSLPVLYLGFGLPLFTGIIDQATNPMQLVSTGVAYKMLQLLGFQPWRIPGDPTSIMLSHFTLNVAVPCSGMKLIIAVTAFTAFFMMIGRLKWWGNLGMLALVMPLCLFINGLRIALIGMVGDSYGQDAGMTFHDYSGYLTLLLCFFILFKTARALGWKD